MHKLSLSGIFSVFVIVVSLFLLVGWQFDLVSVRNLITNTPLPMTLIMLLALAIALLISRRFLLGRLPSYLVWLCPGIAAISLGIALWAGAQYILHLGPSLEFALYPHLVSQQESPFPGRPAPHTVLACLFIGAAISISPFSDRRLKNITVILGLLGIILPWIILFGYAGTTNPFYPMPNMTTGMSPITAICFIALSLGTLALRPSEGFIALFTASSSGGRILRRLVPLVITIPLLLGWIISWGLNSGLVTRPMAFALVWGLNALFFTGFVVWQAFVLHREDSEKQKLSSERELLLESMKQAADQIQEFNKKLTEQADALEKSNLELRQFAYIASHDLQSPLRSISGFAQLLQVEYGSNLGEQANDWIGRIVRSTQHMQTLISDLLSYSRVDSQALPFHPVRFQDVFDDALILLEASVRAVEAQITCDELPILIGDHSQLVQLMQNLIGNGIKYHGEKPPRIHVSAVQGENEWIFSVRDNGIGIAPQHYERIFEIFRRLHDQQQYPGTGIGLAVCRRVVQHHGGRIWLESEPGHGSVFYFTIPNKQEVLYE